MTILHITNGQYCNAYLQARTQQPCVPFCEAMMEGPASADIWSEGFIRIRAAALGVSTDVYRSNMGLPALLDAHPTADTCLHLWFGADAFCQVNLLTLLAWLEQRGFDGRVTLHTIDDRTFREVCAAAPVTLGGYTALYRRILLDRAPVEGDLGVLHPRGIALYFDYLSADGALARIVRDHPHEERTALVRRLLDCSADYGMTDRMAAALIDRLRN